MKRIPWIVLLAFALFGWQALNSGAMTPPPHPMIPK